MTLTRYSPKVLRFLFILSLLFLLPLSDIVYAKKKQSSSRQKVSRAQKGKKASARVRRSVRGRQTARNARDVRRGRGRVRTRQLTARELRRQRQRIASEQSAAIRALERRKGRALTKRERAKALRSIEARYGRAREAARRRAEAARRAAIARQRALEEAMRNEVQSFIAMDKTAGEDPEVRRVAINALGHHAGTVVVMDPMSGRIYSAVNQEWAYRRGFKPCSTIKLVTGLAGLNEKVIDPADTAAVSDRYNIDLTDALAYSNNTYFQQVGSKIGFDRMVAFSKEMGLGERTGVNVPNEYAGQIPYDRSRSLGRMWSHGDDYEVTPIQLATLVAAMSNGGKVLVPYVPDSPGANGKSKVRKQLDVEQDNLRRMVPGMVGAVNYGSGKKAYDPLQTVAGKTGTCIGSGGWLGLFTSYAPLANPRLAVVVIARGSDGRKHFPAAVAGRIYRELNSRFGTPINLQIATTPSADEKESELNEEEREAAEAEAAEMEVSEEAVNAELEAAAAKANTPEAGTKTTRQIVKPVIKPIETTKGNAAKAKPTTKTPAEADARPRRTQPE